MSKNLNGKIEPFSVLTAAEIWADEHTSQKMLEYHFDDSVNAASRGADFMDHSAAWIAQHFNLGKDSTVIDFGCGPGLYTTRLASFGAKVSGIDFSKYSLKYAKELAKEHNLNINYYCKDYLEADIKGKYDLIIMIMCDYCALPKVQRQKLLKKFYSLLKQDGAILLDVCSFKGFENVQEYEKSENNLLSGFWSKDPYLGHLKIVKYDEKKVSLDHYIIEKQDKVDEVYYWVQYFDKQMIAKEFKSCDLIIDEYYADVAGTPWYDESEEFAVVARKIK